MSQPIPRSEYPRPQFVRPDWLCLNGPWEFQIDSERTLSPLAVTDGSLTQRITVPFCPESTLSGIGQTDFMPCVWYRRSVTVPKDWQGCRVLLHFEAVDDDATVWVNGVEVARHRGGSTPFTCDLGDHAQSGDTFTLVVRALDDHTQPKPQGKQCPQLENHGCLYTRTTGIWQTVWLEAVPMAARLEQPRITPDVTHHRFTIDQRVTGGLKGQQVRAVLQTGETHVAEATVTLGMDFTARLTLDIPEAHVRLWSPEDPHLYDLTLQLLDANGDVLDEATSYAGLRSIAIDGLRVLLNGKPVFQRLVLDQGYYPDGLLTAPSDDALRRDIELSIEAGFNGARLHQKVFEQRFLHHADRMGYLCWGEFGDWGPGRREDTAFAQPSRVTQWLEVLHRDYNHPRSFYNFQTNLRFIHV